MQSESIKNKKRCLASLILGILAEVGPVRKSKLAKLILMAEIEHFNRTGESITGLYFVRLRKGPVIAFFDEVLEENEGNLWSKEIEEIPIFSQGRMGYQYVYSPISSQDLPGPVVDTIRGVAKKYGTMTGTQLSAYSYNLPAWKYSELDEPIYVPELAIQNEEEYFALVDLIEDLELDGSLKEDVSSLYDFKIQRG